MGTEYDAIYERAVFRFTDFDWLPLSFEQRADILEQHLKSAIGDFANMCREDLHERDEVNKRFAAELPSDVIEILAAGVAYHWLSSRTLNSDLLRNNLSTRDYSFFSPANLLEKASALRQQVGVEYRRRIIAYTYRNSDIADWKV